jgi:hypothetical protein
VGPLSPRSPSGLAGVTSADGTSSAICSGVWIAAPWLIASSTASASLSISSCWAVFVSSAASMASVLALARTFSRQMTHPTVNKMMTRPTAINRRMLRLRIRMYSTTSGEAVSSTSSRWSDGGGTSCKGVGLVIVAVPHHVPQLSLCLGWHERDELLHDGP